MSEYARIKAPKLELDDIDASGTLFELESSAPTILPADPDDKFPSQFIAQTSRDGFYLANSNRGGISKSSTRRRPTGHVRDWQDGGRSDEYRGDSIGAPEIGTEACEAYRAILPEIRRQRDARMFNRLVNDYVELVSEDLNLSKDGVLNAVIAKWRIHLERRPDADPSEINEAIADLRQAIASLQPEIVQKD